MRPFNTYGPRQSSRAIIPTIITQALTNDEIKLGNTAPVRDVTYMLDIVDGFIKIAESRASVGEVINIGFGKGYSIKNFVEEIQKVVGKELKIVKDETRMRPEKSEVMELVCSNEKAKKLLNWTPKHSLQEGLQLTKEYMESILESFKKDIYNI